MISKLSELIALYLYREQIIDEGKTPVCAYGIELIISTLIGFILVCLVGLIMNALAFALIFYLVFVGVRLFTGGYHADSHIKCKITLIICSLFVLLCSKHYEVLNESGLHILFLAIYLVCVFLLSPVEHVNAPLTEQERKRNRGVSIIMAVVLAIVNELGYLLDPAMSAVLTMSLFTIAMLMIIAKLKEGSVNYEEDDKRTS